MEQAVTTINGSTALKPGETLETGNATSYNDGTKTTVTGDEIVTVTPPNTGSDMNIDRDGSVKFLRTEKSSKLQVEVMCNLEQIPLAGTVMIAALFPLEGAT